MNVRRLALALPVAAAGFLLACSGSPDSPAIAQQEPTIIRMLFSSSDPAAVAPGTTILTPVRVEDAYGYGVAGVDVSFTVTAGGGTVTPTTIRTNAAGMATASWTVGTLPGQQSLQATVPGLAPVQISTTVVLPVSPVSVCNKLPGVWQGLNTKVAACPDIQAQLAAFGNVPVQQSACLAAVGQCSSNDIGKLNTFLDCMNALPDCTTATMATWGASLTACYNNDIVNANISAQCKTAVGLN